MTDSTRCVRNGGNFDGLDASTDDSSDSRHSPTLTRHQESLFVDKRQQEQPNQDVPRSSAQESRSIEDRNERGGFKFLCGRKRQVGSVALVEKYGVDRWIGSGDDDWTDEPMKYIRVWTYDSLSNIQVGSKYV